MITALKSKSVRLFAVVASISFFSANASAPNGPSSAYKLRVTALMSMTAGAFVYFSSNHQCGSSRAYIDASRADYKTLYATLLAAQNASSFVSVDLRDTTPGGSCNGDSSSIGNLCVGDESGPCFAN